MILRSVTFINSFITHLYHLSLTFIIKLFLERQEQPQSQSESTNPNYIYGRMPTEFLPALALAAL